MAAPDFRFPTFAKLQLRKRYRPSGWTHKGRSAAEKFYGRLGRHATEHYSDGFVPNDVARRAGNHDNKRLNPVLTQLQQRGLIKPVGGGWEIVGFLTGGLNLSRRQHADWCDARGWAREYGSSPLTDIRRNNAAAKRRRQQRDEWRLEPRRPRRRPKRAVAAVAETASTAKTGTFSDSGGGKRHRRQLSADTGQYGRSAAAAGGGNDETPRCGVAESNTGISSAPEKCSISIQTGQYGGEYASEKKAPLSSSSSSLSNSKKTNPPRELGRIRLAAPPGSDADAAAKREARFKLVHGGTPLELLPPLPRQPSAPPAEAEDAPPPPRRLSLPSRPLSAARPTRPSPGSAKPLRRTPLGSGVPRWDNRHRAHEGDCNAAGRALWGVLADEQAAATDVFYMVGEVENLVRQHRYDNDELSYAVFEVTRHGKGYCRNPVAYLARIVANQRLFRAAG